MYLAGFLLLRRVAADVPIILSRFKVSLVCLHLIKKYFTSKSRKC